MSTSSLTFKNVWKNQTDEDTKKIVDFWKQLGVLPAKEDGLKRATQVVFIAQNGENELGAICTSYLAEVKDLHGYYYHFRCLVHPEFRQSKLAGDLLNATFDLLEELTLQGNLDEIKGMYIEVENQHLLNHKNEAVWPKTNFVFVGITPKGTHRRVRYFKGARI